MCTTRSRSTVDAMLTTPHQDAPPTDITPGARLRTQALTKTYGSTRALDHVDLTIPAGQSVAVMGPSGSGKTTLLHCLSGILSADSGSIELNLPRRTVNVESLTTEDRAGLRRESLGFVFQQGMLVPELTAVENTALPLMLNGTPKDEAIRHAAQWLGSMGLAGMEERRIGQLSGGQAQRVAIARSQVIDSAIVFATVACPVGVNQAAAILDRRGVEVGLDIVGMDLATQDKVRRITVISPMRFAMVTGLVATGLLIVPMVGVALVLRPVTILVTVGTILIGAGMVRLGLWATRPTLNRVLADGLARTE